VLSLIGNIFKILLFFIGLWRERDQAKAREKGRIAKEIVNVFQETNNETQASRLNAIVGDINRLRG